MTDDVVVGCKLLREDGGSLTATNRIIYPLNEWIEVPGNGAYLAVTGGLYAGGVGPVLAYMECKEPTGIPAPGGVVCFRRVRRVPPCPERIDPELRGCVACCAPDLSPEQRVELARNSTPGWRGLVACYGQGLSPEQRAELAQYSTPYWRAVVEHHWNREARGCA